MGEALASLVFPAPCRICTRILDTGSLIPFCHACIEALTQTLVEPLCSQCGRPIVSAAVADGISRPLCHVCRSVFSLWGNREIFVGRGFKPRHKVPA